MYAYTFELNGTTRQQAKDIFCSNEYRVVTFLPLIVQLTVDEGHSINFRARKGANEQYNIFELEVDTPLTRTELYRMKDHGYSFKFLVIDKS